MAKQPGRRSSLNDSRTPKRGPTHRPSVWAGAIAIFILLTIAGVRVFGDYLYDYPDNLTSHHLPKGAAIICLAGGKHRIEAAYSLYAEGVGDRLLIVGAGKKSTPMALARAQAPSAAMKIPPERFARIIVETESRNTIENAFAVKRYLEQNPDVKEIVLVTSSYHMRRAQFMISQQLPAEVRILPFSPPSEAIERANWWHSWVGIQVTVEEYVKFLLASLLIPHIGYF